MAQIAKLSKEQRLALQDARNLIADIHRRDGNEAETRRRVERIFERIMNYDTLKHLSRERAVHGVGDTEHVDFAIQLEPGDEVAPAIMVEIKRVGIDLAPKHLKQASRYAIDAGCEWVLLTNARQWQLYHVEFGQPPVTDQVESWDLLQDNLELLAEKFDLIGYRNVRGGVLGTLWQRTRVLAPESLLRGILSVDSMTALRRVLRRDTGVAVSADHVVTALRRVLNDTAATILDNVQVSLPTRKAAKASARKPRTSVNCGMSDLLSAGLIQPEAMIFADYKDRRYEATVMKDGSILFERRIYKTLSAAGGAVTEKHGVSNAPNGWAFWSLADTEGTARQLEEVRQEFVSASEASETEEDSDVAPEADNDE